MSERRSAGTAVYMKPCSGFVGNSDTLGLVTLVDGTNDSCMLACGDPDCQEWDVELGDRGCLYHVSECQMLDAPFSPEPEVTRGD